MREASMGVPNAAGWEERPLKEVCELINRGTAPVYVEHSEVRAIGQRCVQSEGFAPAAARFHDPRVRRVLKAQRGDVLLNSTGTGTIGRSCLFDEDGSYMIDSHVTVLRTRENQLDPRWLNFLLQSSWGQRHLESHCYTGSTNQVELSRTELVNTAVPLPPVAEQRRIAEILDALDNQIKAGEKLVEKQLQIKQGLLEDLSRETYSNNNLVTLAELSELITSGSRSWAQYYSETGALFIRVGNLTREHINLLLEEVVYVEPPRGTEGARTALRPGDVLISITADLGIIGVVPEGLGEAYVNQHISLVRPRPHVNPRWVGHMLASEQGQRQFKIANDAGAKAGLNLSAIGRIHVPLPPRATQDKIAALLDEQDYALRQQRVELEKLRLLKQGLMEDLLTGRVRVPVGAGDGE